MSIADVTGIVAALATLAAVVFAFLTVRQAAALRREDRLARLTALAGELGVTLMKVMYGDSPGQHTKLPIIHAQFEAAVAGSGEDLPACTALLDVRSDAGVEFTTDAVTAAVNEIASRLK